MSPMLFSELCKIMVEKVTFIGFWGDYPWICPGRGIDWASDECSLLSRDVLEFET